MFLNAANKSFLFQDLKIQVYAKKKSNELQSSNSRIF